MTIKKKWTVALSGFVLAIGIAGCSNSEDNAKENEDTNKKQEEQQSEEGNKQEGNKQEATGEVAAVVNGEEISMDKFNQQLERQKSMMKQNGMEVKDKQLNQMKSKILTQLINTELLLQKANEAGIEATEKKVNERYESMTKDYSKEEIDKILKQNNTTVEKLKKDLAKQIKIDEYVAQNTEDVKVTDEEIQKRYDAMKKNNDKLPALDKVKPQLKQQIQKSKEGQQISKLLDKLRKESEIEKKVQV
ncbi:SurA N-terminal domain-containing protein [Pontibacillus marinus]|uniref:peptidylprolyl isomerase n=1 Tax=Pontibacillus marinus BH030004 = DSM 16465 TaxID=1385511 RepID=A0A0A5GK06_9BACI|nr:SurA N-terminal domain-containing protein [Pontibacillus marinus]KGX91523.1 hypothetical protein N783_07660 [Pontibacillus marinus BH030004 = DSM 16465]